jgi:hypothetical protein
MSWTIVCGSAAPALNVVDRGTCSMGPHRMSCFSNYFANTGFEARLA